MRFTIDSSHLVISLSTPKSHVTLMPGQKPSVIMTSSEIGLFLGAVTANSPTWRASKEERGGGGERGERGIPNSSLRIFSNTYAPPATRDVSIRAMCAQLRERREREGGMHKMYYI